jgi:hypothetical protein
MPKTKISEFSSTPANNTDIDSINIAEGCAPSGINDAIRELMAQLKDFQVGSAGDPVTVGGVLTVTAGAVGTPAITTAGDTNTGIFFPAADTIAFAEGGAESMRIDSSGNLGIGTNSPAYKLDVQGGAASVFNSGASANSTIAYRNGTKNWYAGLRGDTSNAWAVADDSAFRLTVDSSGNVGIGQTPSVRKFEINAIPATANQLNGIRVQMNGTPSAASEFLLGSTASGVPYTSIATGNDGNAFMFFSTGSGPTERARIDPSGNLLVGQQSTTATLGASIQVSNSGGLGQYAAGPNNVGQTYSFGRDNVTTGNFVFAYNGSIISAISPSTGGYTPLSDSRVKKNITPLQYGLGEILQLNPVAFNMISEDDSNKKHIGLIAQEVKLVMDETVDDLIDTETQMYGLDKSVLVPVIIKAMQEQQALIQSLTDRITALESA